MQAKKGFTLIELLVVIAIIAILAAILFPVFANARDKARQISDLSNIKQIALSTIMYTNDYDDTFPIGNVETFDGTYFDQSGQGWISEILPYAGSVNIWFGPDDTLAGQVKSGEGQYVSIGANGLVGLTAVSRQSQRLGVFGDTAQVNSNITYDKIENGVSCKLAEAAQPTQTVLYADEQAADTNSITNSWAVGETSAAPEFSLIGNNWINDNFGYYTISYSTVTDAAVNAEYPGWQSWALYDGHWQIPTPGRSVSAAYPGGPNGIVSAPFSSKSLANFAFLDGHAKAMKPAATNPDGRDITYSAAGNEETDPNNEWIVVR